VLPVLLVRVLRVLLVRVLLVRLVLGLRGFRELPELVLPVRVLLVRVPVQAFLALGALLQQITRCCRKARMQFRPRPVSAKVCVLARLKHSRPVLRSWEVILAPLWRVLQRRPSHPLRQRLVSGS
jgi:hypothetical protein